MSTSLASVLPSSSSSLSLAPPVTSSNALGSQFDTYPGPPSPGVEARLRNLEEGLLYRPPSSPRDLNSVSSFISVAIRVLSFLSGMFSSSSAAASSPAASSTSASISESPPQTQTVDRIDSASESLDIAMGTLMAFGGKYLRRTAVWLFDQIEESSPAAQDKVSLAGGYLESLSPSDLEELATSAVAAGANPLKLQEAFIKATNSGDWSDLEEEISSALGPEAVGGSSIGGSLTAPFNSLSNMFSGLISQPAGGSSSSTSSVSSSSTSSTSSSSSVSNSSSVPGGPLYYVYKVQDTINRIDKVISTEPNPSDPTTSTVINRFIKEFHLEKEALSLQTQMNSVIRQVNTILGDETEEATASSSGGSGGSSPYVGAPPQSPSSVSQAYTLFGYSIPDPLKFLFEDGESSSSNNKEDLNIGANSGSSSASSSVVAGGGISPLAIGAFGVIAALGTLAVGSFVSSGANAAKSDELFPPNSINKVDTAPLNYEYLSEGQGSSYPSYSSSQDYSYPYYEDYFNEPGYYNR